MGKVTVEKEAELRSKALEFLTWCFCAKQPIPIGYEYPFQLRLSYRSFYYVLPPFHNHAGADFFEGVQDRDEVVLFNLRLMHAQGYNPQRGPLRAYMV
jgi:hypothetical protein